jgi:hypothetical protein
MTNCGSCNPSGRSTRFASVDANWSMMPIQLTMRKASGGSVTI